MKRLIMALALAALVAVAFSGPSVTAESNCATLIFENNTTDHLYFFVDKEQGHRCSVFVQYGSCRTFVTAGKRTLEAKYDDGTVAVTDTMTFKCGDKRTWTIVDAP